MREFRSFSSAQSSNPRGSTHSHPSLLVIRISDPPRQAAGLWEHIQERGGSWGQTYSRMETRCLEAFLEPSESGVGAPASPQWRHKDLGSGICLSPGPAQCTAKVHLLVPKAGLWLLQSDGIMQGSRSFLVPRPENSAA